VDPYFLCAGPDPDPDSLELIFPLCIRLRAFVKMLDPVPDHHIECTDPQLRLFSSLYHPLVV